jgi:hypothetical protein
MVSQKQVSQKHAANIAELKTLTDEYRRSFNPIAVEERFLVDTLAHSEWRGRQYSRLDSAILESHKIANGNSVENSPGKVYCRASKDLQQLHRLADSTQRIYEDALRHLLAIRSERTTDPLKLSSGLFLVPKRS